MDHREGPAATDRRPGGKGKIIRYKLITDDLRRAIQNGTYGPGGKLPYQYELAEQYGVSTGPCRRALGILQEEGLIHCIGSSGAYVRGPERTPATGMPRQPEQD